MPTFVSNKGVWYAAKEKVGGLTYKGTQSILREDLPAGVFITGEVLNPGDPFMYDGIDREALRMLHEQGYDSHGERVLGTDFRHEPEFLQAVRNMGFGNVTEYLDHMGYNEKVDEQSFKERAERTKSHEVAERVKALNTLGGGRNTAEGGTDTDLIGGFGPERIRPAKEAKKTN